MAEIVKKLQEQAILAQEENFIDWDKVLKKFQQSFGNQNNFHQNFKFRSSTDRFGFLWGYSILAPGMDGAAMIFEKRCLF